MKAMFVRYIGQENDKRIFFSAFFGGVAGIFILRLVGDRYDPSAGVSLYDVLSVLWAVGIIIAYVVFITISKKRTVYSLDRASDNAYYLGLMFTLTSLSYSLGKLTFLGNFDDGSVVEDLLPDFGIALASTIVGIGGRIYLQEHRQSDPVDAEMQARHELGMAVRVMRAKVGLVISDLNRLSNQTNHSLTELRSSIAKTLEADAVQHSTSLQSATEGIGKLTDQLRGQTEDVSKFTIQTAENFDLILERISGQLQGVEGLPELLGASFDALSAKTNEVNSIISEIGGQQKALSKELINTVKTLQIAFSEKNITKLTASIDAAEQRISSMSDGLEKQGSQFTETLNQFSERFQSVDDAAVLVDEFVKRVKTSTKAVDDANAKYVKQINQSTKKRQKE